MSSKHCNFLGQETHAGLTAVNKPISDITALELDLRP